MYLVSAYFDDQPTKTLNRLISCIADKSGNDFMISHKVPPHLTLCQIEAKSEEVLVSPFHNIKNSLQHIQNKNGTANNISCKKSENHQQVNMQIFFASTGFFKQSVIYAAPVYNETLDFLVKTVYSAFCNIEQTKISSFYKPMSFMPHVTLGKTLTKEQMKNAFDILQDNFFPFKAKITRLGLSKVKPYTDLAQIDIMQKI